MRPLGGWAFTADPPEREDGGPRLLPVPRRGRRPVPMTLVVDFGPGVPDGNPRPRPRVRGERPAGGTIAALLEAAGGCAGDRAVAGGRLVRLEGVAENPGAGRVWSAAVGGGARDVDLDRSVPFGGLVELRFGAPPGGGDGSRAGRERSPPGDGSGRVRERAVELRIDARDDRSPAERLPRACGVDGRPGGFEPYAPVRELVLPDRDGDHDVCVEAIDEAQNVSAPACVRLRLDRSPTGAGARTGAGGADARRDPVPSRPA